MPMVILGRAFFFFFFTNGTSISNGINHATCWYTKLVDRPISRLIDSGFRPFRHLHRSLLVAIAELRLQQQQHPKRLSGG